MNDETRLPAGKKRRYSKPQMQKVALRPEEAVLGGCKSSTAAGPAALNCAMLGCSSLGS